MTGAPLRTGDPATQRSLRVLVVDDSAVMRELLSSVLARDATIRVAVAADPVIAMVKMKQARPDVLLLDLEMPRLHGLNFLRKLMAEDPIPVVVCSAVAPRGTDLALRALEEGAVEIFPKPRLTEPGSLDAWGIALIRTLHEAARARMFPPRGGAGARPSAPVPLLSERVAAARVPSHTVIAIGASTGGPDALRTVLTELPGDCAGIVIAQHMPSGFTAALARQLDSVCALVVQEAVDGDAIVRGRALIAPGDQHMLVLRTGGVFSVSLSSGPKVSGHRPSVDVLFRSVARAAGRRSVGVILTGMGSDGAQGLLEMRKAGALTVAQDEETCMVFGMPKEAVGLGAATRVLPLPRMAAELVAAGAR
jgi:two-component system chemotaxis response regulator CheB